ncbi:MAG: hypothetical protein GY754_01625 [bacterium]|nr:hypothetical protein [bacterium]
MAKDVEKDVEKEQDIGILTTNELKTNIFIARILPFLSIPLIIIDVFVWVHPIGERLGRPSLTAFFGLLIILFFIPYILHRMKITGSWIKYFNMTIIVSIFGGFYYFATGDAPIFFPFPIVISAIYFNKKLVLYTFLLSTPLYGVLHNLRSLYPMYDHWLPKAVIMVIYFVVVYGLTVKCLDLIKSQGETT